MNDEYPTEEVLRTIKDWDATKAAELMEFVKDNWWLPDWGWREWPDSDGTNYSLSTGGWSGNEQLIRALEQNYVFWALYWMSNARGGHFVFKIRRVK